METYKLSDLCEILDAKRKPLSALQRAKKQGIYPYYGAQGIIDHLDEYLLDGEYLLVAEDGANLETRNQPIANIAKGKIWVNNHAHVLGSNGICPLNLLGFILNSMNISPYVTGCAQPKLNQENLRNIEIELPSHIDRIASILSSLDRKIELNNKINADLEEMAQAIFKNWFVDFEPFKDGKFVNSELGMIPEGWKVGSPYEYVKVVYGAPYKSAKFNDNGEGLPLIRIRDLKDCKPQFYTPEILPQTEYVNMGDIVAGMDAEFVPHIWKGKTGLLNQRVCKLIPQQTSISNLFVLYLMKPELEFVQSYKTGTTVSHLGKADIDKFVVVLPPLEVVEDCSKLLDSILQRIKNISAESRNLSLLRDTLLPRLMSGEIEVPE